MKELFGEMYSKSEEIPLFYLQMGSAVAHITVQPWGDDECAVNSRCYVVREPDIVPELMHYLLRKNDTMRFDAFGLDKDDDIFFEHAITGTSCTKADLRSSVLAVVLTADKLDDEIVSQWGGKRLPTKATVALIIK